VRTFRTSAPTLPAERWVIITIRSGYIRQSNHHPI
jgi:hypothetical protein